jgi:sec-independent protein translocase protein TatC
MIDTPPTLSSSLPTAPLVAHLMELRTRVLWAFGSLIVATILAWAFVEPIYGFLVRPLADAMGTEGSQRLIYTNLTEAFFTYMKVAFFAGLFVTLPIILAQIWLFIAPGLYHNEKGAFIPFIIATPTLFYLGGAVVYYAVLPLAWGFFLSFQSSGGETVLPIVLEARVGEYLDLVMVLILAFGVAFELPVLLMLLARLGVVNATMLARRRKYAIIVAFIVAAPLTPPDIISQTCLAIPLILLYELSILLIRRMPARHAPA